MTNTFSVGADINWVTTRANHERDEILVGSLNTNLDIFVQRYNSTDSWDNIQNMTTATNSSDYRAFDIAFEDISGDALIVFENGTADNDVSYIIWNGKNSRGEQG